MKNTILLFLLLFTSFISFAQDDRIYKSDEVETPAKLKMTLMEFSNRIKSEIVYPKLGKELGIEGSVLARITMEKDGTFSDVKIMRGIGGGYDEEAIRFIRENLTDWESAKVDGKFVRHEFYFPIRYNLKEGWTAEQAKLDFEKHSSNEIFADSEKKEALVFTIVEQQATFNSGLKGFYKYIKKEMTYPKEAQKDKIEGKVILSFIINTDGSVSDVKVLRGIGHGCDEEAIRIIENSPPWIPGKQRGNPIRQQMTLPIIFKL